MSSPGYGENGSVIGPQNLTSISVANGVWSLGEMTEAQRNGTWPNPDVITSFGWMTLPSGAPAPARFVTEIDMSGNPVVLAGTSASHNYVLELDKATHAFTYMRDYTLNDGQNFRACQLGITPSGYYGPPGSPGEENLMFLGGECYNRNGNAMQTINYGRIKKSGSTGWDTFNPYGTSSNGYASQAIGASGYEQYMAIGRISFKSTTGYPASSDPYWFPPGGSWKSNGAGQQQRARFEVNKDSYSGVPDQYAVGHIYGNNYNCKSLGSAGLVGNGPYVALISTDYYGTVVLISTTITGSGGNLDLFNSATQQLVQSFAKLGTFIGTESGAGSQRVTGGNNDVAVAGIISSVPNIARVNQSGGQVWAKKITPTTFASTAVTANTGAIVSTDGTKVYTSWTSCNGNSSDRGWAIIACWNWADGTLLWKNRLTWDDANQSSADTRFYEHSMKEMSQDSTGDSLLFSARIYQDATPSFISAFPVVKLRTDGLGHGTYTFPGQTGAAGGTISMTYAADTSPVGSSSVSTGNYPSAMNFGVGVSDQHSQNNAAVTSGYTWEVA